MAGLVPAVFGLFIGREMSVQAADRLALASFVLGFAMLFAILGSYTGYEEASNACDVYRL